MVLGGAWSVCLSGVMKKPRGGWRCQSCLPEARGEWRRQSSDHWIWTLLHHSHPRFLFGFIQTIPFCLSLETIKHSVFISSVVCFLWSAFQEDDVLFLFFSRGLLSKRICWNHCEILPHQQNISTVCILPSFVLVRIGHLYVQALSISALHHEISQLPTRCCVWLYWSRQQTWQDSRDFPEIFSQPKPRKCLLQQVWLSVTHVPKTMVQWISRNT